jgi:site-specific recombinase XerC
VDVEELGDTPKTVKDMPLVLWTLRYTSERRQAAEFTAGTAKDVGAILAAFCRHAPRDPRKLRAEHVRSYMSSEDVKPSTARRRLSAVRAFVQWLVHHGAIPTDVTVGLRTPRVRPGAPRRLQRSAAATIRRAVADGTVDHRVALMLSLELEEGLRRVELHRRRCRRHRRRSRHDRGPRQGLPRRRVTHGAVV